MAWPLVSNMERGRLDDGHKEIWVEACGRACKSKWAQRRIIFGSHKRISQRRWTEPPRKQKNSASCHQPVFVPDVITINSSRASRRQGLVHWLLTFVSQELCTVSSTGTRCMSMGRRNIFIHSTPSFALLFCFSIFFHPLLRNKGKQTFHEITVQFTNHFYVQAQRDLSSKTVWWLPWVAPFMASMPRPWVQRNDKFLAGMVTVRELNVYFSTHHNVQGLQDTESVW